MQSALDRRQAMLEMLSDRRQETVANLMAEFGVSRCTILRDIERVFLGTVERITVFKGASRGEKRLVFRFKDGRDVAVAL